MMDLKIRELGDPILREKAKEVEAIDDDLRTTLYSMKDLMIEAEGVGLAAPQVGIPLQFFVARMNDTFYFLINPRITAEEGLVVHEEGCLSIPNKYCQVERAQWIRLEAKDEWGQELILEVEDLLARIFQHELDHLHGCLIIDKMLSEEGE